MTCYCFRISEKSRSTILQSSRNFVRVLTYEDDTFKFNHLMLSYFCERNFSGKWYFIYIRSETFGSYCVLILLIRYESDWVQEFNEKGALANTLGTLWVRTHLCLITSPILIENVRGCHTFLLIPLILLRKLSTQRMPSCRKSSNIYKHPNLLPNSNSD